MKKFGFIIMIAAAVVAMVSSCNEMTPANETAMGDLVLTIGDAPSTKAASITPEDYEKSINSLDLYVFEGGSVLYFHERLTPGGTPADTSRLEYSFNNTSGSISAKVKKLPATNYTLLFVANIPSNKLSGLTTVSAIEGAGIDLSNCSTTASSGFAMFAKKENVSVTGGQTTTVSGNIELERFASRVRLVSVKNGIPSSAAYANNNQITINGIFLSNVASAWTLGAANEPTTATNVRGKQNNANITPSTGVTYPVTLKAGTEAISQGSTKPLGWNTYAFQTKSVLSGATEPKLVICATVNGTLYYYPVFLVQGAPYEVRGGIERNKSYDITLEISGTGSTDPDARVERGSIAATVTVKAWTPGEEYSENI